MCFSSLLFILSFMPTTLNQAVQQAALRLHAASQSARLDAELLLCHVLGKGRSYLYTWPEYALDGDEEQRFQSLLQRRLAGEPMAHILGRREFWSLELQVSPATLIPRSETELLVEQALQRIPTGVRWSIADLGTGSGAIALALASERPLCRVVAVDASAEALAVAHKNASLLDLHNVEFLHGNWFEPCAGMSFNLIVSNPPYIPESDPHLLQGDVRFEPLNALASGADGLDDIRRLIALVPAHLQDGGWFLFEHGYDQGQAVLELLQGGGFEQVVQYQDLQGHPRVSGGVPKKAGQAGEN